MDTENCKYLEGGENHSLAHSGWTLPHLLLHMPRQVGKKKPIVWELYRLMLFTKVKDIFFQTLHIVLGTSVKTWLFSIATTSMTMPNVPTLRRASHIGNFPLHEV